MRSFVFSFAHVICLVHIVVVPEPAHAVVPRRNVLGGILGAAARAVATSSAVPVVPGAIDPAVAARIAELEAENAALNSRLAGAIGQVQGFSQSRTSSLPSIFSKDHSSLFYGTSSGSIEAEKRSDRPRLPFGAQDILRDWALHNPALAQEISRELTELIEIMDLESRRIVVTSNPAETPIPADLSKVPFFNLRAWYERERDKLPIGSQNGNSTYQRLSAEADRRQSAEYYIKNWDLIKKVLPHVTALPWSSFNWFEVFGPRFTQMELNLSQRFNLSVAEIHSLSELIFYDKDKFRMPIALIREMVQGTPRIAHFSSEILDAYFDELSLFSPTLGNRLLVEHASYIFREHVIRFEIDGLFDFSPPDDLGKPASRPLTVDFYIRDQFSPDKRYSLHPELNRLYLYDSSPQQPKMRAAIHKLAVYYQKAIANMNQSLARIQTYGSSPLKDSIENYLNALIRHLQTELDTLPQRFLAQHQLRIEERKRQPSMSIGSPIVNPDINANSLRIPNWDSPEWYTYGFKTLTEAKLSVMDWADQLRALGGDANAQLDLLTRAAEALERIPVGISFDALDDNLIPVASGNSAATRPEKPTEEALLESDSNRRDLRCADVFHRESSVPASF